MIRTLTLLLGALLLRLLLTFESERVIQRRRGVERRLAGRWRKRDTLQAVLQGGVLRIVRQGHALQCRG